MFDVLKRHEIHVLSNAGIGAKTIAKIAGVSARTVQRILKEPLHTSLYKTEPPSPSSCVGRPKIIVEFAEMIRKILNENPDINTAEILRRLREQKYTGGKTAVYEFVAQERPSIVRPIVRFEGLPGEFSQHDFGQFRVTYANGNIEVVHFFASRLKYSRWSHVKIVPDEKVESLVRALLEGFESFGGIPLLCVFDNPKTIVTARFDNVIHWNETFGQVSLDYRFGVELCFPYRPNQKGAVENLVGFVKNGFFKQRRFHDRADMEDQLRQWLNEINNVRPSRATGVSPAIRIEEERRRLRGLVMPANEYALRFPIFVGPTAMVEFQGVGYSMDPKSTGIAGTIFVFSNKVRIVAGKFQAEHPRFPQNGQSSVLAQHRAQMLASVTGARARSYYQRQQIFELGNDAVEFLTELVHRRSYTWKADVEKLHALLQEHGEKVLLNAIRNAKDRSLYGSEYVADIIKQKEAVI